MTEQKSRGGLDFEELRRAIEDRDAEALVALYADDAELRIVNRYATPSYASLLIGKTAISGYVDDVCGRAMTHHIEHEVVGEGRAAFNEACEYPDGTRVLCAATLEIEDAKIIRQLNVEVWDE